MAELLANLFSCDLEIPFMGWTLGLTKLADLIIDWIIVGKVLTPRYIRLADGYMVTQRSAERGLATGEVVRLQYPAVFIAISLMAAV